MVVKELDYLEPVMQSTVWRLVRDERLSLAGMLEPLPADAWTTPSLCTEWTVHHVLAHLVMTPAGEPNPWAMSKALMKARGRLWTAGRDIAIAYACRSPHELACSLRDLADARTKPVFVAAQNILLDLVVHGQDIAVPLGMTRPVPDAAAGVVLARIWAMGWPFHAARRLEGVRLRCDSSTTNELVWTAGLGPQVDGSAGDLALLMTGRTTSALPRLRGPGVQVLRNRLEPWEAARRDDHHR
jgi:uncharacterized protein (TIGR03083 family)